MSQNSTNYDQQNYYKKYFMKLLKFFHISLKETSTENISSFHTISSSSPWMLYCDPKCKRDAMLKTCMKKY